MANNPRNLILKLLQGAEGEPLSAREAVASAALLGIRENSVRVALVRLAAAGLIEAAGRGTYRLGPKAVPLATEVASWRNAEQRIIDWDGGWIAVNTSGLGRSDRVALRARDRAFAMLGLRELEYGLFLRPDNLVGGVAALRERLLTLGLGQQVAVFRVSDFDALREQQARALWDGKALNRHYRDTRGKLDAWLERAGDLEPEVAARESFLVGSDAIRSLVFDPLLPSPLVDTALRHAFFESVMRYDRKGHEIWRNLRLIPAQVSPSTAPPPVGPTSVGQSRPTTGGKKRSTEVEPAKAAARGARLH